MRSTACAGSRVHKRSFVPGASFVLSTFNFVTSGELGMCAIRLTTKARCVLFRAQHRIALETWLNAMHGTLDACCRANEFPNGSRATLAEGRQPTKLSCTTFGAPDMRPSEGGPSHGMGAASSERALMHLRYLADNVLDLTLVEVLQETEMHELSVRMRSLKEPTHHAFRIGGPPLRPFWEILTRSLSKRGAQQAQAPSP